MRVVNPLLLRRGILLGGMVLVLSCGLVGLMGAYVIFADPEQPLAAAKDRWLAGKLSHYRLNFDQDFRTPAGRMHCQQAVEVQDDTVVSVLQNSCNFPGWTVTQLFRQVGIARSVRCVFYGCACDLVTTERVVYDVQLGYPLEIGASWAVRANWRHPDYWKLVWSTGRPPRCAASDASFSRTITVTLLTPIP